MLGLRILLVLFLFTIPAFGQGESVWNVYCNEDYSNCAVAKEPSGELMFAVFSTPVTWNDAWAWMSANGFPAQPAVWNVYCNGDRSRCTVAKEPTGEFMFAVFSTLCMQACVDDPGCKAFTYVKPGVQGTSARCWLKNAVPNAVPSSCCISGVKEEAINSQGSDLTINGNVDQTPGSIIITIVTPE